jgi:hypothetical protein
VKLVRAAVLLVAWPCLARADPPTFPTDDPRALFGLPPPAPEAPALDCSALGPFGCVFPTDPMEPFAPAAVGTTLGLDWLADLPQSDATHDRLASFAAGTAPDPLGLVVPGASAIENRWLVDGAPADDVRGGGPGTRVPLIFVRAIDVTTGGFAARDRASTGAIVDAELRRGTPAHEIRAGAWLTIGAPSPTIAPTSYVPVTGATGAERAATVAIVASGPLPARGAWYFGGVQARLAPTSFTGTARREVDLDDDGVPDRDPTGALVTDTLAVRSAGATSFDVPFVARAGVTRGAHDLALTLVGDWRGDTRFDPMATLSAGGTDERALTGDAVATYRGRWAHTRALVQWAWHRSVSIERAHDPAAAAIPQLDTAFVPNGALLPDDFALGTGCDDVATDDPYPTIANCPMPTGYFARGGVGQLTDVTADRPSATASVAREIGEHRVELGVTGEDARLVVRRAYSGGSFERTVFGADKIDTSFVALGDASGPDFPATCAGAPCRFLDSASQTYRARSAATWLEETWRPDPSVAADVGARWEYLHLSGADALDEILPRAGLAWDPLGGGRSRVFAGFARTAPLLPVRVDETIAGGPTRIDRVILPIGTTDFLHPTSTLPLASGAEPMIVDDVTVGGEVALASAVRFGIDAQWRTLRRGLDSNGTLLVDTPALRDSGALTVQLATAPGAPVSLRLAYTYTRAFGTWTGPADPSLGATYYAGPDGSGAPPVGDLPSDLRHRLVVEVVTTRHFDKYTLVAGGRAIVASGRPVGAFDGEGAAILARGAFDRTPPATAADIHVALRRARVEAGLDVLNVFDHRPAALVDERYTTAVVGGPIVGGDASDLVFLRADDGTIAARNPGFGRATAFLAPLTITLYARAAF